MKRYDALVIGGGILGCFAARELRRYDMSVLLIEEKQDVCTGITKANSAIVYAGYDNKPGSLKAEMCVKGNAGFEALCRELDVEFSRCGALMVSYGGRGRAVLEKKFENGRLSGVPGLELIQGDKARELEPLLSPGVDFALYSPSTGTVNPWRLGIAAFENATANGCEAILGQRVEKIAKEAGGYTVETARESFSCRFVINCAGLYADRVQELLFPPSVRIFPDGADFLVLDKGTDRPGRIIFEEDEEGKGLSAVPCIEGQLLLGPTQRPYNGRLWASDYTGLEEIHTQASRLLPGLDMGKVIRSFASVRPNPHRVVLKDGQYVPDGRSIGSFVIERPAEDFLSFIGIKTPGLTCAHQLGKYAAKLAAGTLSAGKNTGFDPVRRAISAKDGHIVCHCEGISRAEILEAIDRGARDVEGVKRRVGTGMGRCQGSRCSIEIERLIKERGNGTL